MTGTTTTTADAPPGETAAVADGAETAVDVGADGDGQLAAEVVTASPPHRLRDLDGRGRLCAALLAVALLLAPVQAFAHVISDWVPASDPALIGIQSLAVGTHETPLTGQPSTSAFYVEADRHVDHLGPLHHYLLAGPVRVMGLHVGMLSVSLLITGGCILIMAWATFRRLGPLGGALGAAVIGLITFATGASSLMVPVSSNLAGYPLYCSAILIWCVLRGDLRLLPLATGITTFAAQQHLSVLPTVGILTLSGIAGLLYHWGRRGRWRETAARHELLQWAGISGAMALVLWSPVLLQQVSETPGNLTNLARLSVDDSRPTVGLGSALRQLAHVLGWPPLLGNLNLTGWDLVSRVDPATWVTAGLVLAILAWLGLRWRRSAPEQAYLVLMAGLLVVAGLVNGSSVLDGAEMSRLVMYHWVFALSFFVVLGLALGAAEGLRRLADLRRRRRGRAGDGPRRTGGAWWAARVRPAFAATAVLAVAVPALVNPTLDRRSNRLSSFYSPVERHYLDDLVDQVLAHRQDFDEPLRVRAIGHNTYNSLEPTLALYLLDAGLDVRLSRSARHYVPDSWVVDSDHDSSTLLLVQDYEPTWHEMEEGELIADVITVEDFDVIAYDTVVRAFTTAEEIRFGAQLRGVFEELGVPDTWVDAAEQGELASSGIHDRDIARREPSAEQIWGLGLLLYLDELSHDPGSQVTDANVLQLLLNYPLAEPELDAEMLRDLAETRQSLEDSGRPLRLRAYLLDADEVRSSRD